MIRSSTNRLPGQPLPATRGRSGRLLTVLSVGLVLLLVLLRLVHLGADTPPELSRSDGLYVDEGYKTLSPRNLVLFGTTHWSPADRYEGWISSSPLTQWSYYASFRLFGADIESARYVTVLFFAVFLSGFVLGLRGRYSGVLLLGGLALLGLESTLFLLSRIAVFEFPIIALFYGLLFVFARMDAGRLLTQALLAIGMSVLLVFGIKVSALLYLAPVFLASSLFLVLRKDPRKPWHRLAYAVVALLSLVALLVLTRDEWTFLLKIQPLEIASRILDNPLVEVSPIPILAGLLCAFHLVVCKPDLCLGNLYRLSLVCVALLGIPLVAVFSYDPMRYYVPLLPAYLLVVLEWIHLRGWEFRSVALRGTAVAVVLLVMLPLFLVQTTRKVGSFLLSPSFQAQQIRSDLVNLLPEDSILGGVWAPFFALGTPFKVLYIAAEANYAARLPELAPDYVVRTESTGNSRMMMMAIRVTPGMRLGKSVYLSKYNQKVSAFYPLIFDPDSAASRQRGPRNIGRSLLRDGNPAAAEPNLRFWLDRLEAHPNADPVWFAEARSDWGACLTQLGRYAEAEQALLSAYQVFRPRGEAPAQVSARATLKRLVALYRAWNKPEQLAQYRSLLERA